MLFLKNEKNEKTINPFNPFNPFNPSDLGFTVKFGRNMMIFSDHSNRSTLMDVWLRSKLLDVFLKDGVCGISYSFPNRCPVNFFANIGWLGILLEDTKSFPNCRN